MSSSAVAIRLEHVTKRYRAGRSRTIVDVVASAFDRLRGREHDVYSAARGRIDATVFALRDVSFEVAEGAGLGIIGPNGAGKTSLLKLISRGKYVLVTMLRYWIRLIVPEFTLFRKKNQGTRPA